MTLALQVPKYGFALTVAAESTFKHCDTWLHTRPAFTVPCHVALYKAVYIYHLSLYQQHYEENFPIREKLVRFIKIIIFLGISKVVSSPSQTDFLHSEQRKRKTAISQTNEGISVPI